MARLEVATTRAARRRGLLGRDEMDGTLLLRPANSVHTFGMRFPIDVALCDRDLKVVHTCTLTPWRLTRPRLRVRAVIEAPRGAFQAWGIRPGTQLAVIPGA